MNIWHDRQCLVITRPVFAKGIKRNALIKLVDTGELIVVPWRSLRRKRKGERERVGGRIQVDR